MNVQYEWVGMNITLKRVISPSVAPTLRVYSENSAMSRGRCICVYGLFGAYDSHGLARQASRFVCQCQRLRCTSFLIVDTYSQSVGIRMYFRPNCVDGNQ